MSLAQKLKHGQQIIPAATQELSIIGDESPTKTVKVNQAEGQAT